MLLVVVEPGESWEPPESLRDRPIELVRLPDGRAEYHLVTPEDGTDGSAGGSA